MPAAIALLTLGCAGAWGSGPRFVAGPPFFTAAAGTPVRWKQTNLMYFTDPGDLSAAVPHAAADALVAAAAGVWNIPMASLTVARGGELAEHVSSANAYLSVDGMVWPNDVMSTNAAAVPIAVVYDTDGSVTDLLLGSGASDPVGCQQNAVTETVDLFDPAGYISHAIVVLNGRCTGTAPEQQLQMQYQLERAFGRVLGLAWSQTNDNVFTGTPQPTYNQALNWPIMHPLDILCGLYSYQCLPQPFTLRSDDIAGMVGLYPIAQGTTPAAGKQVSLADANSLQGFVNFPTGEGMEGVNVLFEQAPRFSPVSQGYYQTSAVTGSSFRRAGISPFLTEDESAENSMGTTALLNQGYYFVPYFAITDPFNQQTEMVSTEPVNPLYIAEASVGPYAAGMVSPAGSAPVPYVWLGIGAGGPITQTFTIGDAPPSCGNGADGTAAEPVAAASSGWWNGLLCGYGHAAYAALPVKSGRTLTVEVTALDANGFATTAKAMPVIGLFAPTDAAGALPSLGVAAAAFNGLGMGTTKLDVQPFAAGDAGGVMLVGIADQRGDGRPDFAYQARVFYADSLAPAMVATGGGTATISGMGFRAGNQVLVNGVNAAVTSWTATTIVLTSPTLAAAGATAGTAVDVEVIDLGTGATSRMSGVLTYDAGALPNQMLLVSAPSGTAAVGAAAATAFAVQVVGPDGVTPVAGETVVFSATSGAAQFGACGAATCNAVTGANGIASTTVTPTAAGTVTVQAADGPLAQTATFTGAVQASSMKVVEAPEGSVGLGVAAGTPFQVQVLAADGKTGLSGQLVTFSVTAAAATYSGCNAAPCSVMTNGSGMAWVTVTPTAAGTVTLKASDGAVSQQVSLTGVPDAPLLKLVSVPSAQALVGQNAGNFYGVLTQSDGVTPITNVPVVLTAPPGISFFNCGSNTCVVETMWNGETDGSPVLTAAPGTYTLQMAYGSVVATTTLTVTVGTPTLAVVSAPSGQVLVNSAAAVPFAVQLLDVSGNPMGGQTVNIGGTQNQVVTSACGTGNCYVTTDGNGVASVTITPLAAGPVTLNATWLNLNVSANFTAVGGVETLNVVTAPPAVVAVGQTVPFAVRALAADGVTPLPNLVVWMLVNGAFAINGCASGDCEYWTDANGLLSLTGTAVVPGTVTLLASTETGNGMSAQMSFTVTAKPSLASLEPQTYVAACATASLTLQAAATQSGGPATGVVVAWTGATGFAVSGSSSTTNAAGDAAAQATVGPLAVGAQAAVKACAWTTACAMFNATGVAGSVLEIAIASGGQQAATGGAALKPVTAQVTDGAGHPVLGATVTVGQTARALDAPCPATGRCPAAPVLAQSQGSAVSDANGMVSVTPLVVPGTATSTALAFSVGTQGFATAVVSSTP
jgi:hypothetical protein